MKPAHAREQLQRLEALVALSMSRARSALPLFVSRTPWTIPNFYVDPSNDSGNARNSNPGTSPSAPILDTAELNRRTFLHDFVLPGTVFHMMSDDPSNTLIDFSTWAASTGTLTFQGTPKVNRSGTFETVTPIDPATNTRESVTDGGFDFSTLQNQIIVVQGGGNNKTSAWIMSGTTAPSLTQPMQESGLNAGAFSPGDSYEVQQGPVINLAAWTTGPVNPQNFSFADMSFGPASQGFRAASYLRCAFQNACSSDGLFGSCLLTSGFSLLNAGSVSFLGGGLIITPFDIGIAEIAFGFHPYLTGAALIAAPDIYSAMFVTQGIQLQDITSPLGALQVNCAGCLDTTNPSPPAKIWGNGNTGPGVRMQPGASLNVCTNAGLLPTVTGAGGDVVFTGPGATGDITHARAFDPATGAYTEPGGVATRATTWTNFAAALGGGGFNFHMQVPETGAQIVGYPT